MTEETVVYYKVYGRYGVWRIGAEFYCNNCASQVWEAIDPLIGGYNNRLDVLNRTDGSMPDKKSIKKYVCSICGNKALMR